MAPTPQAQTFTTLYSFSGGPDGSNPVAGLVEDNDGNLYSTTEYGGIPNWGVVYELDTAGTETVLHSFTAGPSDGYWPLATVLRDKEGNLYGTAVDGGTNSDGVVYKIDTDGNETILYNFMGGISDGCAPSQGVVMDKSGNLYGTTAGCGASGSGCGGPGCGTVFKLTPEGKETLLHSFVGSDGSLPEFGHLLIDDQGDLYGVTSQGGASNAGELYRLTARGKLTVLHSFAGGAKDGCYPFGTPAVDKAGNFYGTTAGCGASNEGTVWKVSQKGAETILHSFAGGTSDGAIPRGGVVLDSEGNLYGDTYLGGEFGTCLQEGTCGVLYELARGKHAVTLLHSFSGSDGANPIGEVLRDAKGNLYGTTQNGGSGKVCNPFGCGTVWSYVP